jgi:Cytochrome P460
MIGACVVCGAAFVLSTTASKAQEELAVARYNEQDQLVFPDDADTWVHMGSTLGGEYTDEPFDPDNPGTLGVVQMEPEAYRYFLESGEYADGTMFLLSFYSALAESDPQLPGFVQGPLQAREIHVIDRGRYEEGRGFYLFAATATAGTVSDKIADGSPCVQCHVPEGAYDGTFTQFYPPIRDLAVNSPE